MFNPQMFEQAKQNINPDMMKQMSGMFANMSDDQIRQYAQMAGMGNIDPSLLRNSASMMNNMKNEDIKNMTNIGGNKFQGSSQPQQSTPSQPQRQDSTETFPIIVNLKAEGNEAFKKQNYDQAASKYYEAILEIEEIKQINPHIKNDKLQLKELETLESQCRLNLCNVKAKQGQFDIVKKQAEEVLKFDTVNGKAYFRLGQALQNENKIEKAYEYLVKAKDLLPQDQTIFQTYQEIQREFQKCKSEDKESKNQNDSPTQFDHQNISPLEHNSPIKNHSLNHPDQQDNFSSQEHNSAQETSQKQQNTDTHVEQQQIKSPSFENENDKKQTKKQAPKLQSVNVDSKDFQELKNQIKQKKQQEEKQQDLGNKQELKENQIKTREDEVIFEDEIEKPKPQQNPPKVQNNSIGQHNKTTTTPSGLNMSDEVIDKSYEQFKNMSPEQMEQITNMFKNMDKNFLKSMMRQQMGYDMTDSQIDMMRNMMNPEMLQTMKNMDPQQIKQMKQKYPDQQTQQPPSQQQTQQFQPPQAQFEQQSPQSQSKSNEMPQIPQIPNNMSGMFQDPEMIKMLLEQLKQNPQMLKGMGAMLGPNHPIAGYLERASPENIGRLIGFIQKLVVFVIFMMKIYKMGQKYWLLIVGILLAYILFR